MEEVEIEGFGTIQVPNGATLDQIEAELARRLAQPQAQPVPIPEFPMTDIIPGQAAERVRSFLPIAGATIASTLFPPLRAARAAQIVTRGGLPGLLGRAGVRFGPTVAAGGAGGGLTAAGVEAAQGGGVGDITQAGLSSATEMAGAEAVGLGATGLLAKAAAPAAGVMTDVGRKAIQFARGTKLPKEAGSLVEEGTALLGRRRGLPISPADVAPGRLQTGIQAAADFLLPSRIVTQGQRRKVVARVLETPPNEANQVLRELIKVDTSARDLIRPTEIAKKAARALGQKKADALGFDKGQAGPREFLLRALTRGDGPLLKQKLDAETFNEVLTNNIERLISKATREVDGRRVIDGDAMLAGWNALPDSVKKFYPRSTREAVENFASFAAASRRVPEAAAEGILTFGPGAVSAGLGVAPTVAAGLGADAASTLGVGAGVAAITARSLMNPKGLLNRWLTNEKLPPEVIRVIGGQTVKTGIRAATVDDEDGPLGP